MADKLNLLGLLLQDCWPVLALCLLLAFTLSPVSRIPCSVRAELAIAYSSLMLAWPFLIVASNFGTGTGRAYVYSEFRFYILLAFGLGYSLARFRIAGNWRSISGWIALALYVPFLFTIFVGLCRRRYQ